MTKKIRNVTPIGASCRFCGFFEGKKNRSERDTPWLKTDDYSALASIGGFVPGWSLACPNKHGLNLSSDYQDNDFWSFVDDAVDVVSKRYGDISVFEHGSQARGSQTSCGTAHAHLHIVPLHFSLEIESIKYGSKYKLNWIECSVKEIKKISNGKEYLFVSDRYDSIDTVGNIAILNTEISQFFRQVIAKKLEVYKYYNYKENPMIDITTQSTINLRDDVVREQFAEASTA